MNKSTYHFSFLPFTCSILTLKRQFLFPCCPMLLSFPTQTSSHPCLHFVLVKIMKIEFKRIQIYSPSIDIMPHIARAGDSSLHIVPFRQVKRSFAGEKAHSYLKFLYPIYWEDSQEVFREQTFPSFFFQIYLPRAVAANPDTKRVHGFE